MTVAVSKKSFWEQYCRYIQVSPELAVFLQFDSADNEEKEQAKEGLDKARARSDKYKGRVEEGDKVEPPKVEASLRCSLLAAELRLCNQSCGLLRSCLPINRPRLQDLALGSL